MQHATAPAELDKYVPQQRLRAQQIGVAVQQAANCAANCRDLIVARGHAVNARQRLTYCLQQPRGAGAVGCVEMGGHAEPECVQLRQLRGAQHRSMPVPKQLLQCRLHRGSVLGQRASTQQLARRRKAAAAGASKVCWDGRVDFGLDSVVLPEEDLRSVAR